MSNSATTRNMRNKRVVNVGTPTAVGDAVSLGYEQGKTKRATAATAVGTSAGAVTGLTGTVAVGTYKFKVWAPLVNVGSPTNVNFGVTGPTTSAAVYTVKRSTASGTTSVDQYAALTDAAVGTAIVATLVEIEGTFVATAAGTLAVRGIRAGGTSATTQVGSYLTLEKIA